MPAVYEGCTFHVGLQLCTWRRLLHRDGRESLATVLVNVDIVAGAEEVGGDSEPLVVN